jgi:luciferase family oxidoreductase group 1
LFSAQLAAQRGLPYAFASHFAPRMLMQAIDLYRSNFVPSAALSKPRVVVGVPLVAAATDDEAQLLASSIFQRVSGIVRGERRALQPPVANYLETRDAQERAAIADFLAMAVIGGPATVAEYLKKIIDVTEADELMLVCDIFDPAMRLRSLDIAAAAMPA